MKRFVLCFLMVLLILICSACTENFSSDTSLIQISSDLTEDVQSTEVCAEDTVNHLEWPMPEQTSYLDAFSSFNINMTPDPSFFNPDWSDEARNTYIKVPALHKETVDGVTIEIEFFQEEYPMYSFIQARITYTNTNDYPIYTVIGYDEYFAGCFVKNDSDRKTFQYADPQEFNGFRVDREYPITLNKGDSFVGELIYFADNSFFEAGCDYKYVLRFTDEKAENGRPQSYTVTVPVEVCAPKSK